jgi:hypothetical protein
MRSESVIQENNLIFLGSLAFKIENKMTQDELRNVSFITYGLERLFYYMQYLSPANLLFATRADVQVNAGKNIEKLKQNTIGRGRCIEYYVLFWIILEFGFFIVTKFLFFTLQIIVLCLITIRLLDIFQISMNLSIFDRLRIKVGPHHVASFARTVILTIWNYFEVCVCFSIIYSTELFPLSRKSDWIDALYFSSITQLTIGYGDIKPLGITRIAVAVQGFLGFLIAVLVISRVVSFLPRSKAVFNEGEDTK